MDDPYFPKLTYSGREYYDFNLKMIRSDVSYSYGVMSSVNKYESQGASATTIDVEAGKPACVSYHSPYALASPNFASSASYEGEYHVPVLPNVNMTRLLRVWKGYGPRIGAVWELNANKAWWIHVDPVTNIIHSVASEGYWLVITKWLDLTGPFPENIWERPQGVTCKPISDYVPIPINIHN